MPHNNDVRYRPCVGITLFNHDGLVFVGHRIDTPGAWQMPQGGIDADEPIKQAFFRELREEVGTDKAEILQIAPRKLRYLLPPDLQKRFWNGRYIGQEQQWIAARFLGEDSDIDITQDTTPEFGAWKWVRLEDTVDLIVPFKRDVYREVIAMFSNLASQT